MPFGTWEIVLIVAVLFLLFGASRLPQLAKSLGQSRKAFKEGMRDAEDDEPAGNQLNAAAGGQLSQMSDEALAEEVRRRSEVTK